MTEGAPRRRTWADGWGAPALVAVASVAVFLRAVHGAFVFDDQRFIVRNAFVQKPESWLRFLTDASTIDPLSPGGIVRPLRTIEFALDRAIFGMDTAAFHVHSFLWHAAASVLLLLVLRRLLGDGRAALLAALVWAVHPVQTESVAWISSRGDVAMGACTFGAVLFALRSGGRDRDFVFSLAFAAIATLYKETAVALPFAVAVLRWTGRVRVSVWPYVAVAASYLLYRRLVQSGETGHGVSFELGGGTVGTFATMIRAFGFYAAQCLLPAQSLDWYMPPSTSFADSAVLFWLALHAGLLASAVLARRASPSWTLAVAWFYVFLLPVANWPYFVGIPTTERFLYVPLAGAAIAVGVGLTRAPRAACAAAVVAVLALGASSVERSAMWRTEDSVWRAVLADHESPRARSYAGEQDMAEGIALRTRASRLPEGPERDEMNARSRAALESSLSNLHRSLEAWYGFELSNRSRGSFARLVEVNASNVAYLLGRFEEALFHADEALLIPGTATAEPNYDRALPLLKLGFAPQAVAAMRLARAGGFDAPDVEIGTFFLRAAAACEADAMPDVAEGCYVTALEAAPAGPLRREAASRLAALRDRLREPGSAAKERARIAELEASLARLPRRCPAPRGPSESE